jgi:hypothetical protein
MKVPKNKIYEEEVGVSITSGTGVFSATSTCVILAFVS